MEKKSGFPDCERMVVYGEESLLSCLLTILKGRKEGRQDAVDGEKESCALSETFKGG